MTSPRFLQIHTLSSYPAVLLNRDDAGLAKRLPYGGAVRTRISSQCLKRHWRKAEDEWSLQKIAGLSDRDFADRSRLFFSREISGRLIDEYRFPEPKIIEVVSLVRDRIFKSEKGGDAPESGSGDAKNSKKKKKEQSIDSIEKLDTKQAFILTRLELDYLTDICRKILDGDSALQAAVEEKPKKKGLLTAFQKQVREDLEKNLDALRQGAVVTRSVEAALFGRMVTSDLLANTDAAIHVAHAFTVHEQHTETDYFTVVDDLKRREDGDDAGSAGIFDSELTSGVFYGYVVVDVPALVSNLTGAAPEKWADASVDRALAAKVVEHLIHLIATVSPGAKKGSTAPYGWAHTILVEAGSRQPRSLAAAFEQPVRANGANASLASLAEDALARRITAFDRAYGAREARRHLSIHERLELSHEKSELADRPELSGEAMTLDALAAWAGACVARAEA